MKTTIMLLLCACGSQTEFLCPSQPSTLPKCEYSNRNDIECPGDELYKCTQVDHSTDGTDFCWENTHVDCRYGGGPRP